MRQHHTYEEGIRHANPYRSPGACSRGPGCFLLAGCGGKQETPRAQQQTQSQAQAPQPTEPAKKKTLVWAVSGGIDTFDPAFTVGSRPSQTVLQNIFDQLEMYGLAERTTKKGYKYFVSDTTKIQPMLAERSVSPDGKKVTWKIRKDVKYHNGNPVDAKAIFEGYKRLYDTKSSGAFLLSMGGLKDMSQMKVVDNYTLEWNLENPNDLVFLNNIMHNTAAIDYRQLQQIATEQDKFGTDYFKKNAATGNGPYVFKEYKAGDRIVLEANPNYYMGKPKIDTVMLKIIPDTTQRILMLKKGEVDLIESPPLKELADLEKDPNINVVSVEVPRVAYLQMNWTTPPFDNKKVREAIAWATPYEQIIKEVYHGYAIPATSLVPKGMPTHQDLWPYKTDVEKAKKALADAGFPEGKGLPPVKFTIRSGVEENERLAVFMQAALKNVGINVEIEKLPLATFNQLQQGGKLQFWFDTWLSWVNDPFYHMTWIVGSKSPSNYSRYNNPKIDELLNKWTLNKDAKGREEASVEAQKILVGDVAHVYILQPTSNMALRKNVKNYVHANDELPRFYFMDKE